MYDRPERAETFDELETIDPTEELALFELDDLPAAELEMPALGSERHLTPELASVEPQRARGSALRASAPSRSISTGHPADFVGPLRGPRGQTARSQAWGNSWGTPSDPGSAWSEGHERTPDLVALPGHDAAPPPSAARDLASAELLSTTLPVPAAAAYEAFCDLEAIPRWLSVVQSVRVARTTGGRPGRAGFVARLHRSTIGYTLFYRYSDDHLAVSWGTDPGSLALIAGRAQFLPLGERAALMQYQLALDLPGEAVSPWSDPFFGRHATSVVMNDFREYVVRVHRRLA